MNESVNGLIYDLRNKKYQHERLFSTGNDNLCHHIVRSVASNGFTYDLNEAGNKKIWMRLRDSLDRILLSSDDDTPRESANYE